MRNTVSEAALNVQTLTTILQANADANPDSCQTDEWKALLAAVSQFVPLHRDACGCVPDYDGRADAHG